MTATKKNHHKFLPVVAALAAGAIALHAQSNIVFQDAFTNSMPGAASAVDTNWVTGVQGGAFDAGVSNGIANHMLYTGSGTGSWNIGGIKSASPFLGGDTVVVTFNGNVIVSPIGSPADRGNGLEAVIEGSVAFYDFLDTLPVPTAYNNDGYSALSIELQSDVTGLTNGFDVQHQGTGNDNSVIDSSGIFDNTITSNNPLVMTVSLQATGSYTIQFNQTYNGGTSDSLSGSMGNGFNNNQFGILLACQGIDASTGFSTYGDLTVSQPTSQPLQIASSPKSETVIQGQTAVFAVAAVGTPPLSYAWYEDTTNASDVPVPGQTNASLVLTNVTASNSGSYYAIVSDVSGSATSSLAALTVRSISTNFNDDFQNGDPLSNDGSGGDWLLAQQSPPSQPDSESGGMLTVYSGSSFSSVAGQETANVFPAGLTWQVTVDAAAFSFNGGQTTTAGTVTNVGGYVLFDLSDASNNLAYPNAYNNDGLPNVEVELLVNSSALLGYEVEIPGSGTGSSTTIASGYLNWDNVTPFTVDMRLASNGDFEVQFGVPFANGATNPVAGNIGKKVGYLEFAVGAQGYDANSIQATVGGVATIAAPPQPPVIQTTGEPNSQSVLEGGNATFSVSLIGAGPFTYQWFTNGVAVSGATNSAFAISGAIPSDAGSVYVVVTDSYGSTTSSIANLTVSSSGLLFQDYFGDGDPTSNTTNAVGGGWIIAEQAVPASGTAYAEITNAAVTLPGGTLSGIEMIPSGSGSYNIGGLATTNSFPPGSRVNVVFDGGILLVTDSGSANRGSGIQAVFQELMSIYDSSANAVFNSSYHNQGLPALTLEVNTDSTGTNWGWDLHQGGLANQADFVVGGGIFDSAISTNSPLVVSAEVDENGNYQFSFSKTYSNGSSATFKGSLDRSFPSGSFNIDLGAQAINNNVGVALFSRVQVAGWPALPTGTAFADPFTGAPFVNEGLGSNWVAANQGGGTDTGLAHYESNGIVGIASGAGSYNIGGIKNSEVFNGGTVEFVIDGVNVVSSNSASANEGNGLLVPVLSTVTVADARNANAFPSAYQNNGYAAFSMEFEVTPQASGFDIKRSGSANGSSITDVSGIFDSPISPTNKLVARVSIDASGNYVVTFNKTYGGGNGEAFLGSLGKGFGSGNYIIALGSQGINNNTGYALFGPAVVYNSAYPPGPVLYSRSGTSLVLTYPTGTLQAATTLPGPFVDVTNAFSPYTTTIGTSQAAFFRVSK